VVNSGGDLVASGRRRDHDEDQYDEESSMVCSASSIASRIGRGDRLEINDGAGCFCR
jgi:hypothetical protein